MAVSDPMSARLLVYRVVVRWVSDAVPGTEPETIDEDRKFVGNPPDGYGFSEGRYLQMCDQITPTLIMASGRDLELPGNWRVEHENDSIALFINAVAIALLAAPLTPLGVQAHTWAMQS